MTRDDVKADARAQLYARFEATNAENEAGLVNSIRAGELDLDTATATAEWMRAANLAKLRQAEACSDRLIDSLADRERS